LRAEYFLKFALINCKFSNKLFLWILNYSINYEFFHFTVRTFLNILQSIVNSKDEFWKILKRLFIVIFSPHDQFLATSHVDELGIFLWSNINAYNPRPLKPIEVESSAPIVSLLPRVKIDEMIEISENETELENVEIEMDYKSPASIQDCLTVSGLPNSRWISLINLKLIKMRNKVKSFFKAYLIFLLLPSFIKILNSPIFDKFQRSFFRLTHNF